MKRQILKTDGESNSEYDLNPLKITRLNLEVKHQRMKKKISTAIGIIASDKRRRGRRVFKRKKQRPFPSSLKWEICRVRLKNCKHMFSK